MPFHYAKKFSMNSYISYIVHVVIATYTFLGKMDIQNLP